MSNGKQRIVFCRICLLRHISVFVSTNKLSERLPKRLANFYCVRGKTKHCVLSNLSFVAFKRDFSTNNISWKNCIERGLRIFIVSNGKQSIVFCRICLLWHISVFFQQKKLSENHQRGLRIFIVSVGKQSIVFCRICFWRHNEWFFKKTFYGKIALKKAWHIFIVPKRKKSQRFKMMLIFATFCFRKIWKIKFATFQRSFSFAVRQRCLKCDFVRILTAI